MPGMSYGCRVCRMVAQMGKDSRGASWTPDFRAENLPNMYNCRIARFYCRVCRMVAQMGKDSRGASWTPDFRAENLPNMYNCRIARFYCRVCRMVAVYVVW